VARLVEHAVKGSLKSDHWTRRVTGSTVEWFPSQPEAEDAEKKAIQTEHPEANIAHVAGRWSTA
jgi:hypothetical protein